MALTRSLMTYQDAIDHLVFFFKANPSPEAQRDARRAIQSALDELANMHPWTYYIKSSRINFNAPITTGTVEYDHTGNTAGERILLLTGTSWPDWAPYGVIIIGQVQYQVAAKISESVLQLSISQNPGEDLDAGTSYTLMRDTYPLPADCISVDQFYTVESWRRLQFIHWREWLVAHRYNVTSSNTPYFYCVPSEAQILTKDGWKYRWEIAPGDTVMGYDPEGYGRYDNQRGGKLQWEPLLDVHSFPFEGNLYNVGEGNYRNELLCTRGHRWPVIDRRGSQRVRRVDELISGDRILLRGENSQEKFLRKSGFKDVLGHSRKKRMLPFRGGAISQVSYDGVVWCPRTPSGMWVMRQGDRVAITGNTIMGDPNFIGVMSARFYPFPDSAITGDFTYRGRSRPLNIESHNEGTVTISADSAIVEGSVSKFTSDLVGAVIRVSADGVDYPTGLDGANPFKEERVVMSVTDGDTLVVDRVFNNSLSDIKYRVSDPLDLEYGAMTNAFLRTAEHQIGIIRGFDPKILASLMAMREDAMVLALESDSRTSAPRSVDTEGYWSRRLAYMPVGADED